MTLAAKRGSWKEASSQPGHLAALRSAVRAEGGGLGARHPGAPRPPPAPTSLCGQTQPGHQKFKRHDGVSLHALCPCCDVSEGHVIRVAGSLLGATGLWTGVPVARPNPARGHLSVAGGLAPCMAPER